MTEQTGQQPEQQQQPTQQLPASTQEASQTISDTGSSPQQQTTQSASSGSQRSSADLEAENRALRAILSGHVDGINIDEELEFVGPTGKYRPSAPPPQQEQVQEQRTSRRQGLQSSRAEPAQTVDIAAIDAEFDNFLKNNYGFDIGGTDA